MFHRTTLAILLALATASVAAAQTPPPANPAGSEAGIKDNLQVTGTVISSEANRLVVKGDNGQQMVFIVNESTAEPHLYYPGDRVTASYTTLAGTGSVVSKVVSAPALTTTTSTTVTTAPVTTTTTVAPVAAKSYDADKDTSVATLPATASSLPLVALLGLFAAGGAVAIRRLH